MTDFDFPLPALPERVWQALTDPAKLATWFMANDLRPEPGHRFTLRPQGLAGFDGPIHAEVLQVEPTRQIMMSWQYAGTRSVVTWLVEPARGGSRLRVNHTGQLGVPAAQTVLADTYRRLYGQRLRAMLSVGMLSNLAPADPPPGAARPDKMSNNVSGEADSSSRRAGRRRGQVAIWAAGCAAVVIGCAAVVLSGAPSWRLLPGSGSPDNASADQSDPPGVGILGTVAASGQPARTGGASPSGPVVGPSLDPTSNPQTSVDGQPVASEAAPSAGPVVATFRKAPGAGGLDLVVKVTLTNSGPGSARWRNAAVRMSGINLSVASSSPSVTYAVKPPLVCLTPVGDFALLPAGTPSTFSFTVSVSLLGDVQSVQLDQSACS